MYLPVTINASGFRLTHACPFGFRAPRALYNAGRFSSLVSSRAYLLLSRLFVCLLPRLEPEQFFRHRRPRLSPFSAAMEPWGRSSFATARAMGLVKKGLLLDKTAESEWRYPGEESEPRPGDGYVVSFAHFHERGFTTPPSRFFRGLLHHYGLELQHLNPNNILHILAFVALCEGYLGIEPNFSLWKYFFAVSLYHKKDRQDRRESCRWVVPAFIFAAARRRNICR